MVDEQSGVTRFDEKMNYDFQKPIYCNYIGKPTRATIKNVNYEIRKAELRRIMLEWSF
jgi:hypothetical protein